MTETMQAQTITTPDANSEPSATPLLVGITNPTVVESKVTEPSDGFRLFEEPLDEGDDQEGDGFREQYFTQKVTPSPTRVVSFLLLETLKRKKVHQIWIDRRPEHYACECECQLCVGGEKSKDYYVGRVYLPDDDIGATVMLPYFDETRLKGRNAVRELETIYKSVGSENFLRVPFELSLEESSTGVRFVVLEADKTSDGKVFMHTLQDPEFVAAAALRGKLGEQDLLRAFSLERDEKLLPKIAKRIRRKLGIVK